MNLSRCVETLTVLGDESRIRLCALLRDRELRVTDLVRVTGIATRDGRATGVKTDQGEIAAEVVVNCAGQWARKVGQMCGVAVPLHSAEHMYIVTGRIEGVDPDLPVMRDPDGYIYFKEEVGGLVMGGYEPNPQLWTTGDVPDDWEFRLFDDDFDQPEPTDLSNFDVGKFVDHLKLWFIHRHKSAPRKNNQR